MPSLIQAIRDKYDPSEDQTDHSSACILFIPKSGPNIGPSGSLSLPQRLTVDNCKISEAGQEKEISELCEKVHELDLSKNDLTDWHEVFTVVKSIPNLQFLNLLMNKLDESTTGGISGTYPSLTNLVLNSTMISWNTVALLLKSFPSLSELHLSLNEYSTVDLPENTEHTNLTKLFVNQCQIASWDDIVKLGCAFPKLESLNLIQTELETLSNNDESYQLFSNLAAINVSETKLRSWEEVDKFRKLPELTHLRITGIQFLEDLEAKQRRQHLVARLPNIKSLNGSKIGETEREDAERTFIRYYMDQADRPARYAELEAVYGKLDPLVHVDMTPKTTMNLLVKFEEKEETIDVDLTQTLKDFKRFLQNFTGLPPAKFRVIYVENFEGHFKGFEPLRLPSKTLISLNINEGDEFQIDRIV